MPFLGNDDVGVIVELDLLWAPSTEAGSDEARQISTAVLRLCGQVSTGPSGVLDQSWVRMRCPIAPPSMGHSGRSDPAIAPVLLSFISSLV